MKAAVKRSLIQLYCCGFLPACVVTWAFRLFALRGE